MPFLFSWLYSLCIEPCCIAFISQSGERAKLRISRQCAPGVLSLFSFLLHFLALHKSERLPDLYSKFLHIFDVLLEISFPPHIDFHLFERYAHFSNRAIPYPSIVRFSFFLLSCLPSYFYLLIFKYVPEQRSYSYFSNFSLRTQIYTSLFILYESAAPLGNTSAGELTCLSSERGLSLDLSENSCSNANRACSNENGGMGKEATAD